MRRHVAEPLDARGLVGGVGLGRWWLVDDFLYSTCGDNLLDLLKKPSDIEKVIWVSSL